MAQIAPITPPKESLTRTFGPWDKQAFIKPEKVYYPETWFHLIDGNVSKKGLTADLEAIAQSGISGIQLFHGKFGGPWPGITPQITCLSPLWEDAIRHVAKECNRLGLRFTMQNCPGWAMSGGPWITPANAMRHLAWSRTDIDSDKGALHTHLDIPQPSNESWRDYTDITVLAFPTPLDDTGKPHQVKTVSGSGGVPWNNALIKLPETPVKLQPSNGQPHRIDAVFKNPVTIRTIELPSVNSLSHVWNYEPGVRIKVQAELSNGKTRDLLDENIPAANWQDNMPLSLSCTEAKEVIKVRIWISNKHDLSLNYIRFYSAARKNNWEGEAAWTLRKINRSGVSYIQDHKSFIDPDQIVDLSNMMDNKGNLRWKAPAGHWTILRIGHVNTGRQNGPAPVEGTGWECDKLSEEGANAHFAGYIGKLSGQGGSLNNGLLKGMLMDSWECETQTWTRNMESEFKRISGYGLRKWLPAVFGYVLKDQETTFRFLNDWRYTLNDLYTNKFFGQMSKLAKANNLNVTYETAGGDVLPADILEYYKFADVPMAEFWQPFNNTFVGSLNFKPIKPATSAARMYGKPRVAAEAFTSFELTWDEQWPLLKDIANLNMVEGITHLVYHTFTHNPSVNGLVPGSSMGAAIGTTFIRQQTWWRHMPEFNIYFARCSYLQERGLPVSDVLWYLGDEINHKPDQKAPFPSGFKYDYCNTDALLNRISVDNGMLTTPEGIKYRILWLPETIHMRPQTLEKIEQLIRAGATVLGFKPRYLGTLSGGSRANARFDAALKKIWGKALIGKKRMGKGLIFSGISLEDAFRQLKISPDVIGVNAGWTHRYIEGADWYFITAPVGESFNGTLDFRNTGEIEIWNPVTGSISAVYGREYNNRTSVELNLPKGGSCFIVFDHKKKSAEINKYSQAYRINLSSPWRISFPRGWGAPENLLTTELKPWKDMNNTPESKAFSGTATYTNSFSIKKLDSLTKYQLQLSEVNMIARVTLNGKYVGTVWCPPYEIDLEEAIFSGNNELKIEVTSTWYNRLTYDASLPETQRKTWTIAGPNKNSLLRKSGMSGPVYINAFKLSK